MLPRLYIDAMVTVSESLEAFQADDSLMLELAVRQYRRVMTHFDGLAWTRVLEGRLRRSKRRLPGNGTHHGRSARHMGARPETSQLELHYTRSSASVTR